MRTEVLKLLCLAALLCCPAGLYSQNIAIDETNFPDENFRNWVLQQSYGQDGVLTEEEIGGITSMNVAMKDISDLSGIEFFTALTTLRCQGNQLTALDLSKNTALKNLYCSSNQLTALDLSKNTELGTLDCSANQLTALDLSQNVNLTKLTCYKNQLTTLDVSQNVKLTELACYENLLTALDVSQNVKLTKLTCYQNLLTSLNVSGAAALTRLEFFSNQIRDEKMDELIAGLPQNTSTERYLFSVTNTDDANEGNICMQDQVNAVKAKGWTPQYYEDAKWKDYGDDDTFVLINEANFPDENFRNWVLQRSYGQDGVLTGQEIEGITSLRLDRKQISDLRGIEYFTALTTLECYSNQLTSLDVSRNTALTTLKCYSNQLTSLDVSGCTALERFELYRNNISGENMDKLIEGLRQIEVPYRDFRLIDNTEGNEGNVCTMSQVAAAKAKGWRPLYYNGSSWIEYKGSEYVESVVEINETNFPDANFRNWVLQQSYGQDGVLTDEEIEGVTDIFIGSSDIYDLKGIEYFTALTSLYCGNNHLDNLDVSKNTALTILWCHMNNLTTLDVSKNTELKELYCFINQIKGKGMDALIESLPLNETGNYHYLTLYDDRGIDGDEGNVCTKSQAAAAKAKGWLPRYSDNGTWVEYEGSDDDFVLGDVTGDGRVDVSDYIGVANFILGIPQQGFDEEAGDVNEDGVIDVTDYLGIGNIIHTGSVYGSSASRGQKNMKREK